MRSASENPAHVALSGVHRVDSLSKRWLLRTYQGAAGKTHLDYYLDEFTFRFNRRNSKARGLLFYRLLEQAVQTAPTSLRQLSADKQERAKWISPLAELLPKLKEITAIWVA